MVACGGQVLSGAGGMVAYGKQLLSSAGLSSYKFSKLAPCHQGANHAHADIYECPICFLVTILFPICTELLQVLHQGDLHG
jgi:hypothetical protein